MLENYGLEKRVGAEENFSLTAEKATLVKALSRQQSLVGRRTSIPILSHFLLEAKKDSRGDVLVITGTDLEMTLQESISVEVAQPGNIAVPAHTFRDLIRKLPEGVPVHLSIKDGGLWIKSLSSEFLLPTLPGADFPKIHTQELPFRLEIASKDLSEMIEDTRFSMSTEEARYALNGIFFHPMADRWCAVATDSHRLSMTYRVFDKAVVGSLPSITVGRKTVYELSKLLEEAPQLVTLSFSNRQLSLSFGDLYFSSRLLEGQFPDYLQAIPKDNAYTVFIKRSIFAESVDRVGMVSSEKQRLIRFQLSGQEAILSAQSQQFGSGQERIPVSYQGPDMVFGFNPRYLMDICNHIKEEVLRMSIKDSASAVLFTDESDEKNRFVLMPLRL